ncbi:MAG: hypothetical protein FWG79_01680, partial [Bacteroidales bacterium]|nr:hypothetical protein [Bacteroidales bacterium]
MKKLLFCAILFIGIASAANGQRHNFNHGLNREPLRIFMMIGPEYGTGVSGSGPEIGDYNANR